MILKYFSFYSLYLIFYSYLTKDQRLFSTRCRYEEDGRREHRDRDADRDRDRERRQKEKERVRRQDEERRRRRERHDGENAYKKREDEGKKEKEYVWEKRKNSCESTGHIQADKSEKSFKDAKKEENMKRDRLRNKVRSLPWYVFAYKWTRAWNRHRNVLLFLKQLMC